MKKVSVYGTLYFDIFYIIISLCTILNILFSIKLIKQSRREFFRGGAITENSEIKYGLCGRIGVCAADPHEFVTCGHI
jgi:hypothetical protein